MDSETRKIEFPVGKSTFKMFCGRYPHNTAEVERFCNHCKEELKFSLYDVESKVGKIIKQGGKL